MAITKSLVWKDKDESLALDFVALQSLSANLMNISNTHIQIVLMENWCPIFCVFVNVLSVCFMLDTLHCTKT